MKSWDKEKVLEILKPILELGYSLRKACILAEIPDSTVWTWLKNDPTIRLKIKSWQNSASMKARTNIVNSINEGKKDDSKWWLERKERADFSTRQETTGAFGEPVKLEITNEQKKRIAQETLRYLDKL